MRRRDLFAGAAALCGLFLPAASKPCTTFCLAGRGEALFAKNYDFEIGHGMVLVNKRGVAKASRAAPPDQPARWVSRWGSVTFNQFGREFPSGGINEAGLVVELLWLDAARYPPPDTRPALGVLEWVQYQLDNFSTVEEVLRGADRVRIASRVPLHYLVGDRSGRCAAIEFLNGRLAHTGAKMDVPALTNDTYADSVAFFQSSSSAPEPPDGNGSLQRFARTARHLRRAGQLGIPPRVEEAFRILADAAQPGYTQWSIVYDAKALRVHFRTRKRSEQRQLDLSSFDFSCQTPVKVLSLDQAVSGEVSGAFTDYSSASNRRLVERAYRGVSFLRATPEAELDVVARHPETTRCQRNEGARAGTSR